VWMSVGGKKTRPGGKITRGNQSRKGQIRPIWGQEERNKKRGGKKTGEPERTRLHTTNAKKKIEKFAGG